MSSAAVGTFSASKQIGFNKNETKAGEEEELRDEKNKKFIDDNDEEAINNGDEPHDDQHEEEEEYDDDDAKLKSEKELDLGPQFSLKEQLEKDKDDESLRRWKEQLLGSVDMSAFGESKEPEVKILSLSIVSPGRPDIILPIPFVTKPKTCLFTLKEGSRFRLKFTFNVSNNIVSGLKYVNTVWKTGIRVDNTKIMLGTFSPQKEPYTFELEEETTPSGLFARGSYAVRTKFVDDDDKVYLDVSYHFEIQKNWGSRP
ncbi:hypothetical protein ERO13_D02G017100v2 [Gossypium hirsutum]|uniref:Rho GDP-dissociation inhibitor 1 n=1 Tax=Gossypium hirsutum TaxID=3635 RepID=A0A1U8MB52_GOSHI|nr:rho GDP-dissociation inhibitor 1 [Gossypium hirsutum]KAG4156760.1 hypothetical protein ERO13_D02G017100v2 [Gossypium hirsutum]